MKKEILILVVFGVFLGLFSIKGEINDWNYPEIDSDILTKSIPSNSIEPENVKVFTFFTNFFEFIASKERISDTTIINEEYPSELLNNVTHSLTSVNLELEKSDNRN